MEKNDQNLGKLTIDPVFVAIYSLLVSSIFGAVLLSLGLSKNLRIYGIILLLIIPVVGIICSLIARVARRRRIAGSVKRVVEGVEFDSFAVKGLSKELITTVLELDGEVRSLRQSRLRSDIILSNMADGIICVNHYGIVVVYNPAAERIFGRPYYEVIGARIEDAKLHPDIVKVVNECISGAEPFRSEIILPGFPEKVLEMLTASFEESGGMCAMVILHDISDIRLGEKSQKEFVGNVSHELRTPITSIRTTAEALTYGAKNDEVLADKFLNTIINESDGLSVLIDDLMEIAKRDSGIKKVNIKNVDVCKVLSRVEYMTKPEAQRNKLELLFKCDDNLFAWCDEMQIEQVVRNLVDNAIKYTHEGGSINVSAGLNEKGLQILVEDTGIGIPQGEVDRIFDRFYRVDKARSRRLGGTGLGLSIVKDIIDAHKGDIRVETVFGKGSKFIITIPSQ